MERSDIEPDNRKKTEECEELLNKIVVLESMDIRDISEKDYEWRLRKVNDVKEAYNRFEDGCAIHFDRDMRQSLIAKFEFSLLKIAYASKLAGESHGAMADFINKYSEDEMQGVEKLENFSGIDALSAANIKEALERKEGKIYEIIKQWYNSQMYEFNLLIDAAPQSKMRNSIKRALIEKYNQRFQVIREGVIQYMSYDAVAPAKLFNQYDDVVSKFYEAQNNWDNIISSFNAIPITEIERKYNNVEGNETDGMVRIKKLEESIRDANDVKTILEKIKNLQAVTIEDHKSLLNDIETRANELSMLIDRGNELVRQTEMRATTQVDQKAKSIYTSQADYLRKRVSEIKVTLDRLQELLENIRIHIVVLEEAHEKYETHYEAQKSGDLVRIDDAVADGINFIYRFRRKMEELIPFSINDIKNNGLIKISEQEDLNSAMYVRTNPEDENTVVNYTFYSFIKKRILGETLHAFLGFVFWTRKSLYQHEFVDSRPMSLAEFLDVYRTVHDEVGSASMTAYVGIYSPTGFEERVISRIRGDAKMFTENIFLYLIDQGSVEYKPGNGAPDEVIGNIFNLQLGAEKEEKARGTILEFITKLGEVSMERISKDSGIDLDFLEYVAEKMKRNHTIFIKRIGKSKVVARRE